MDLSTIQGWLFERVLGHNESEKIVYILLRAGENDDRQAILKLERRPFAEGQEGIKHMIREDLCDLKLELENGIYSKYSVTLAENSSKANVDIIFPATQKHIRKYSFPAIHLFEETKEIYQERVFPYINSLPESGIEWVYNILDGKAESERILASDPDPKTGFVLLPDLKWDRKKVNNLYCLLICRDRNLKSLRDLRGHHIPMLSNMYSESTKCIRDVFHVAPSKIRAYVHYHPSYFHFHIHFAHTSLGSTGGSCVAGRCHLLSDIIQNLKSDPLYYTSRTLVIEVMESTPVYDIFTTKKSCSNKEE